MLGSTPILDSHMIRNFFFKEPPTERLAEEDIPTRIMLKTKTICDVRQY